VFHPPVDVFQRDRTDQFIGRDGHGQGVFKHVRDVPAEEIAREVAKIYGG
jgi:PhnB protein